MRHVLRAVLIVIAMLPSLDKPAQAAEAAIGVYLLGSRAVGAGLTPPPGLYFQDDTYFYSGFGPRVGELPISTRVKVYREFDIQNRMEDTAGFFTVALPLALDTGSQTVSGRTVKAKF